MVPVKPVPMIINTKGFNFDLSAQAEIETNYSALSEALAKNPGLYAVWAVLEANARREYDDLATRLEIIEAELFEEYRLSIGSPVDAIKANMKKDPRRVEVVNELNQAKANLELLLAGKRTIEARKDSLLAIASNYRAEMQSLSQNRINTISDRARDMADRARVSRGTVPPGTKAR
jgi:hypothetical protein